jgi:prepilin-type N-terminal cleavage/methylation domain-containing protein/prepilin-type processing-associated H-X9-DG protein
MSTSRRRCSRVRSGFTLVELLVVIGIIAILVGIILPTMARARGAANRAVCLSNQRQLAQAFYIYASQYKGAIPPSSPKENASTTWVVWRDPAAFSVDDIAKTAEGWVGPGYLFHTRIMKTPKAFYCPDLTRELFTYPKGWDSLGRPYKAIGYVYRVFGEKTGFITQKEVDEVANFKLGKMKNKALLTDIVMQSTYWEGGVMWPHRTPYGANIAFSDGHAEFVHLTKKDYDGAIKPYPDVWMADYYYLLFFRAVESGDYTALRKNFK